MALFREVTLDRTKIVLLFLFLGGVSEASKEAAVWVDDGNGHTVKELLSPQETIAFSETLRMTMGLPNHDNFKLKRNNLEASAPSYMKSIYNTLDELGKPKEGHMDPAQRDVLEKADTVVTFTSKAPPVRMIPAPSHHAAHRLLYFNTSEVSLDHTLLGAELRVHVEKKKPPYIDQHMQEISDTPKVLHVYLVTDDRGGEMKVAEQPLAAEGWLVLNMTAPCLAWLLQPRANRGLRLAVTSVGKKHEDTLHSAGISSAHDRQDCRPILVAYFSLPHGGLPASRPTVNGVLPTSVAYTPDATLLSRSTRSLPVRNKRADFGSTARSETTCQMKPLYVSFSDLDWQDWVIAPNGYDANFCEGRCDFPMPAGVNATNHAIVQTLIKGKAMFSIEICYESSIVDATNHAIVQTLIKVLGATKEGDLSPPAACCAPKDLLTISVLYYDYNNNVVLKKYPKMVVKSCACR